MSETKSENTKNEKKKDRDGLSIIVGGIFILVLAFATYNYFNKGGEKKEKPKEEAGFIESIFEDKKGDINGEGAKEEAEKQPSETKTAEQNQSTAKSTWVATDYKKGDIEGGSYTVVKGDTLWEIAEARYGSGFEWVKILEANKDSIGFLPNGSQALIVPGQVLRLP
ncbi:MAG TPA: LysM peptidoglycan-binding domain-containing protein [bacterium]|nr:LysM peptidoglycan-binding domain-containing protein [bacterium]